MAGGGGVWLEVVGGAAGGAGRAGRGQPFARSAPTPSLPDPARLCQLYRTYGHCHGDITCLAWAPDSRWVAAGSKDLTARVWSLDPVPGYAVPTLAGHKETPVGVFFAGAGDGLAAGLAGMAPPSLYTVSRDGVLFCWAFDKEGGVHDGDAGGEDPANPSTWRFAKGRWRLGAKHFYHQRGARVTCAAHHAGTSLLVVGLSSGVFDVRRLPEFDAVHALSASKHALSSVAFNSRGDWLAVGAARLGQLLVWEWRSESYVLRQQGHYYDVAAAAFSPDGGTLATGADDAKVKLWTAASGFCHVTLDEHKGPVTGLAFLPTSGALLSSSLDGSVRAWDLARYRCFRTLVPPERAQLACVAADAGGDVVAAGAADSFSIYVWSVRTSRVLDVLAGLEGPVCGVAFSPAAPVLASCSWDKTVRLWDVFGGKGALESLPHGHEVLALAWAPDGKALASATLDGGVWFWDPAEAALLGSIEARRDAAPKRRAGDASAARHAGGAFTSLAWSADGAFLVGGGAGDAVCVYDVDTKVMLRRLVSRRNASSARQNRV